MDNKYEFNIDIADAVRNMGFTCATNDAALKEMLDITRLVTESAAARVVKKEFELERVGECTKLKNSALLLEGRAINALLHDCERCVLFCATIGDEIEMLLRRYQIKDLALATLIDACASSAVESLCDQVEKQLREHFQAQGLYLTDRFSPGYGDFSIAVQKDFCAELDTARKIGVHVSDSGIMIPRKSVTALVGISKYPQKSRSIGCADCRLINNCKYRESGVTCYGQTI